MLLGRGNNITAIERMLYSFLVSKGLEQIRYIWTKEGKIDTEYLKSKSDNAWAFSIYKMSTRKLADMLNVSHRSIINSFSTLKEKKYIIDGKVIANYELISKGYFEIDPSIGVGGERLIFYHFLKDVSEQYGGYVKMSRSKMAEINNVKESSIKQYIESLTKKGLIKRENGKIKVL